MAARAGRCSGASAAHDGHHFRAAAARVAATTVLAHVRRATVGAVGLANTHPFVHGPFALVHNGTVPYFAEIRGHLLDAMTPEHREPRSEAAPTASISCT
jgi:predicted glutamine amidotransferase